MATSPKSFVWYELMTTDTAAAEAFYRAVVGWEAKPWGEPGAYTLLSAGDTTVAGLMPLPEEASRAGGRPAWIGYIGVEDVDAAAAEVGGAGGCVHRAPADIPEIGRFAVVADPQGAVFVLFTPSGGAAPASDPMTPGHVGWHELYAADWAQAFEFYAGRFGWTKAYALDMGAMGIYQTFNAGERWLGGMMNKPDAIPVPVWLYYFTVPAIDAAAARVTESGGQVLQGPMEVPGGSWIVQAMDPQGAVFALVATGR